MIKNLPGFFFIKKCIVCSKNRELFLDGLCFDCKKKFKTFPGLRIEKRLKINYLSLYEDPWKKCIWNWKKSPNSKLYSYVIDLINNHVETHKGFFSEFSGLIPIPGKKFFIYKQETLSLKIAGIISKQTGVKIEFPLLQSFFSKPQKKLNRVERELNAESKFYLSGEKLKKGRYLLIDDICSTGYTLIVCRDLIKESINDVDVKAFVLLNNR